MATFLRNKSIQWVALGVIIGLAIVGGFFLVKAFMAPPSLKENLTGQDKFVPPESASKDTAFAFPTLFMRMVGDSARGMVSVNPLQKIDDKTEVGLSELVNKLRAGHQALAQNPGPQGVPNAFNLVLDKRATYGQVMLGIYVGVNGSFQMPFLVTADGNQHAVEPPKVHPQYGPYGWAAWVWLLPDQRIKWSVWPDSTAQRMSFHILPAKAGQPDLAGLTTALESEMRGKSYIPPAPQRLIGFWGYDALPYTDLIKVMDALRYPKNGLPVCRRITLLEGQMYPPPPDSLCDR